VDFTKDEGDLTALKKLDLLFWLASGCGFAADEHQHGASATRRATRASARHEH
jgi:hypothetical protein